MKLLCSMHFCVLFCSMSLFGQDVEFNQHRINYKLSYENLQMKSEKDIGFIGIGADLFVFEELPNLYLTVNSYSGVVGQRPGLITFGMGAGYLQPLFNSPLTLDIGAFVGGGGGGGAPDGGGLITRSHVNLAYDFKKFSLFAGYSRLDFPTGEMGGNNFNFGLTINSLFDTAKKVNSTSSENNLGLDNLTQSRFRVTLLGMRYMHFDKGPFSPSNKSKAENIQLIGMELDKFITDRWYGMLKLNGAVTGGIDGYMNLLVGLGYEQPLGTDKLKLDAQVLGGPSGGGAVDTGGGATFQGALGLRAHLGGGVEIKASAGQSFSPAGNFSGTFLEFGLSKNFGFVHPKDKDSQIYALTNKEKLHGFGIEAMNRTYFSPDKLDKNNRKYDKTFNLIGFQASKSLSRNFNALASTYWAYEGSYGAYAEGWLGLQYVLPLSKTWNAQVQFLGGSAGGGGISLGSGLAYQYSLGLDKKVSDHFSLFVNGGKMQGFRGNFNPYFIDFGVKYNFWQVTRK